MGKIFFTSDLHFFHNKIFIYSPRGYESVEEMNETQIRKWNSVVSEDDIVYVLGDFFMGTITGVEMARVDEYLSRLNGHIKLIIGNHDTPAKLSFYKGRGIECVYAGIITYNKHKYYLSHYPTLTATLTSDPEKSVRCLHGHTHSQAKFYEDRPYMYNVAVDAHDGYPVSIEQIDKDIDNEIKKCLSILGEK